ncbi:MAG: hypothetical protein IH595_02035 [Bacteroidales bacterium]|nr:hypothetical protein [Bacteroidales bacterium]
MFIDGIQRITGIRNYIGNLINTLYDKITFCHFSITGTINDIENICQIEYSGHRSFTY